MVVLSSDATQTTLELDESSLEDEYNNCNLFSENSYFSDDQKL